MRVHQSRPRPAAEVRRECADALLVDVDEHDVVARGRRIRRGAHAPVVGLQLDGLDEGEPPGRERDERRAEADGECDEKLTQAGQRLARAQYVARPPLRSNTAPVVNEFSFDTSHATIAAISSTVTNRPRGIFDSM